MKVENKRIKYLIMIASIILGAIFIIVFLAYTGNRPQKFNDVIIEVLASRGGNKTNEIFLLYFLIFSGVILCFLMSLFFKHTNLDCIKSHEEDAQISYGRLYFIVSFIVSIINVLFFSSINYSVLFILPVLAILYFIKPAKVIVAGINYILLSYAIYGFYYIYVWFGGKYQLNVLYVSIVAAILSFSFINDKFNSTVTKMLQLLIPFIFLIFFRNTYIYNNELVTIPITPAVIMFIIILILISLFSIIYFHLYKSKSGDFISFWSCVAILSFNRYVSNAAVITSDLHHPYEDIIGFSQIFELGQIPFKEYIPVSGMYSIVQGTIFKLFGNGLMSNYSLSKEIFYIFVAILIVALMWKRFDSRLILLFSFFFNIIDYNRVVFILPIFLILSDKRIIKCRNLWFFLYFITSLFHGLYYPVYGAAVCIAFIPLAIKLLISYVNEKKYIELIRDYRKMIVFIVAIFILTLSIPLLIGTFKHTMAMRSQTILADGMPRFGQYYGDTFLKIIDSPVLKVIVYYIISFLPLVLIVWIPFSLFLNKYLSEDDRYIYLALAIAPTICYSFTIIRLDAEDVFARSKGMIFAVAFLLILLIFNQVRKKECMLMVITVTVIISISGFIRTEGISDKLKAYIEVPFDYQYVNESENIRVGEGFMSEDNIVNVASNMVYLNNPDKSFVGKPEYFGTYYLLNVRGCGPMEIVSTPKSYDAASELIDNARNNGAYIGDTFFYDESYYIYNYLMTSGEYVYDDIYHQFVPATEMDIIEVRDRNRNSSLSQDEFFFGMKAGMLGNSFDSLKDLFIINNCHYNYDILNNANGIRVVFDEKISGDDNDFIYIKFNGLDDKYECGLYDEEYKIYNVSGIQKELFKKVYNNNCYVGLIWKSDEGKEASAYMDIVNGQLLIPIGACKDWLLNEHEYIDILMMGLDNFENQTENIEIESIQFCKLRELK